MTSRISCRVASIVLATCLLTIAFDLVRCPPPGQHFYLKERSPTLVSQGRLLWDTVGNFLSTSEFFPLEVNVPDTISSVVDGVSNAWTTVSSHIPRMLWSRLEEMTALFSP